MRYFLKIIVPAETLTIMIDKKYSPRTTRENEEQHMKLMEKLQAKHDKLFEKIIFAQREDRQEIAQLHAFELFVVRERINAQKHMYLKLKWKMY